MTACRWPLVVPSWYFQLLLNPRTIFRLGGALLLLAACASAQGGPALQRGQAALRAEDYSTAAREFEAARAAQGDTQAIDRGLLLSYVELRRFPEAIAVGTKAIASWPNDADLHHWLGLAHFQSGTPTSAVPELLAAQRIQPASYDVHYDLALVYLSTGQYDPAAQQLEQAIKLDPRHALAHVLLGRAYQNSNHALRAIDEFKTALRLDPKLPLGHYHLGYAYAGLGRNAEALAEYKRELAEHPGNPEVLAQFGHTLIDTGAFPQALAALQQATAADPQNADAFYDLGKLQFQLGDNTASITALDQAIALDPNDPSPHFLLAQALEKAGRADDAKAERAKFAELKKAQATEGGMATGRERK